MSGTPTTRPRQGRWRAVQSALVGIAAGMVGVAVSRTLFGPDAAPVGIAIGAVALVAGTVTSWRLDLRRRPPASAQLPRGLRLRHRVHPVAWIAPVAGTIITMLAWAGVAHSSGSGWVQAIGALLGAFLLVGLVAPALPAARARVTCTAVPGDVGAGQPVELTFAADRPVRIRPRWPVGPDRQAAGPMRGARTVVVTCTPRRRGVLDAVLVEVASSAPFGLLWWARDVELPLPRLLHVAPRTGDPDTPVASLDDAHGESSLAVHAPVGEPRGVRPYAAGDPRRAVHWPATAHTGTLMVRESERRRDDPVLLELVLPDDAEAAEREAERMMAVAGRCLEARRPVVLVTQEPDGRVTRAVADRVDLGRRLARAVPS